jgi:hypothetical protein
VLIFDVPTANSPVSSQKMLVLSLLDIGSTTVSSPNDGLRKDGGRRSISDLRRAPAFSCSLEKGKTFSSNVTSRDIYSTS